MKGAMKKLLLSAFVLVVAVSLATASTFAWFTMNNTVRVAEMKMEVKTLDGLLVAVTGDGVATGLTDADYFSFITNTQIETAVSKAGLFTPGTGANAVKLTHVTSNDGVAFNTPDDISDVEGTLDTAVVNQDYISFWLHFRTTAATLETTSIVLRQTGTSVNSEKAATPKVISAWRAIAAEEFGENDAYAAGDSISTDAKYAARVSFNNGTSAKIWDPYGNSSDAVTAYQGSKFNLNTEDENFALAYLNITQGTDQGIPTDWGTADTGAIKGSAIFGTTAANVLTTLVKGTGNVWDAKLQVNIWIEGFDSECFDNIMADILAVALQFESIKVA